MTVELSLPVGGVIPWIGDAFGIPLPENYMVLDGNLLKTLPIESPFNGKLNLLKSLEGKTFHSVNSDARLMEEISGEDKQLVNIVTGNLPTGYGYNNSSGTSYSGISNAKLSSGKVGASTGGFNLSTGKYIDFTTFSTDEMDATFTGSGVKKIYTSGGSYYRETVNHRHSVSLAHKHDISAKDSYTEPEVLSEDSFGNLGAGDAIELPTRVTDLTHARCKFVIRLW